MPNIDKGGGRINSRLMVLFITYHITYPLDMRSFGVFFLRVYEHRIFTIEIKLMQPGLSSFQESSFWGIVMLVGALSSSVVAYHLVKKYIRHDVYTEMTFQVRIANF